MALAVFNPYSSRSQGVGFLGASILLVINNKNQIERKKLWDDTYMET
jgi:hypothetical protein